jgi:hypothetical protein
VRGEEGELGFVLSLGFENVQLFERTVEGAIEVALVTGQQGEALVVIGDLFCHLAQDGVRRD